MKKMISTVCMFLVLLGVGHTQSMYGDEVKADVKMKYVYSFEEALEQAKAKNKLIFFNCFSDWALPCHGMNKKVFSDQAFADWMDANFVNFFTDVTKGDGKALARKYNVQTMAYYLILDGNGEVVHRIVGGSKLPEFKTLVAAALSPKTSLAGMTKSYDGGKREMQFLRDYFSVLRTAEENDKAKIVLDEIFVNLKQKQWSKKENWNVFLAMMRKPDDPYFTFLLNNKPAFVKENGIENVDNAITRVLDKQLFSYALGGGEVNTDKLLEIYLLMQKNNVDKTSQTHSLYEFAKDRNNHNIEGLVALCRANREKWDSEVLRSLDLSIEALKDFTKEDKQVLTVYWQERADSFKGSTSRHYIKAIQNINSTDGIKFLDLSFQEALDKATKENKQVFVDCYTTWCGPCKWLDSNTFRDKALGDYFNANFINIKIDMEKGEGIALRKKLDVNAFPTMFVLDGQGNIQNKIVGAVDVPKMMDKIKNKG